MSKLKFNHDADKIEGMIPGVELDNDKIQEYINDMMMHPSKIFGKKKSTTAEWINEHADDPNALVALSFVLVKGIEAFGAMAMLEAKSREALAQMDIDPRMPEEMKEAIRQAKAANGDVSGDTDDQPSDEEIQDEFEKLKRKYS